MIGFEYKILSEFPDTMELKVNEIAKDGWRLTVFEPPALGLSKMHVVMERQIFEKPPEPKINSKPIQSNAMGARG